MMDGIRYWVVKKIYADHNSSASVRTALEVLIAALPPDGIGLNIGAGRTKLDARVKNMELEEGPGIDVVGSVEEIPFPDNHFDVVVTQEVLEHVRSPFKAMAEIRRVLKPSGKAYVQLPFIIGYHPCPGDYWRFTAEGIVELASSTGLRVVSTGMAVGPAVGFYRIAVEFFAVLASSLIGPLYRPAKFAFAVVLYPIKWLDPLMCRSAECGRISGGYFVVCTKA